MTTPSAGSSRRGFLSTSTAAAATAGILSAAAP
ncbi:MAG: twin-arginine translocation signal domain-containing protein, partial [Planctomycetaceae bacterium]